MANEFKVKNGIKFPDNTVQTTAATGGAISIGTTPPGTPTSGTPWWDSTEGTLKIYYGDGNSSQWVDAVTAMVGPTGPQGEQGIQGPAGADGSNGADGAPGPNTVSTATTSSISGIIKGAAGFLAAASAGTDYAAPNQTMYIGTTSVAINRGSGSLALTGITSIDGSAGSVANSLTVGTGISLDIGTTWNGSAARTISIPQAITTSSSVQFGSFGVGTAASGTSGEIRATNNITAYYSDERLKTNIEIIPKALDKVNQLRGVTFTQNKKAEDFGYTNYDKQVGVIAQDILKVLPEVVKPAPFDIDEQGQSISGENYLTVQYDKLVPLLIEAIKELSIKCKNLEDTVYAKT